MARYCFYCGKELEDNEKCYCRARTRAESAARSASADQADGVYQEQAAAGSSSGSSNPGQSTNTYNYAGTSTNASSPATAAASDKKSRRQESKEKRQAERERLKAARAEAKRRSKAEKERRRQSYQSGAAAGSDPYRQSTNTYGGQQLRSFGRDLLQLLTRPADAIKAQALPFWSLSHTILLIVTSFLGGAHFAFTSKWLNSVLFGQQLQTPTLQGTGLYFTGVLISAFFLLLYAGILWILSRFLFRQGGLPFTHTLAVGKTAWLYLTLFMLIALPTTIQNGFFGIFLVLMGFAFSSLVHARSVAVITHLTENQTMNLTLISILIFTSLFATVIAFFQTIQLA